MGIVSEEWRDVVGHEGFYQVSQIGNVRSLDRVIYRKNGTKQRLRGRVMRPSDNGSGYRQLPLKNPIRTAKIHWLVAEAFLGPRPSGKEINHIDGDKTNNAVTNLEYVTKGENLTHAIGIGLREALPSRPGQLNGNAKLTSQDVRQIRSLRSQGVKIRVLAERFAVNQATIKGIIYRRTWSCVA